ncbi:MAG: hypothetical protein GF333_02010 [Candidatus Omnitrophica bacterium]|nr:hypothetical protein [Candidatus Omnitrophota bacterium]
MIEHRQQIRIRTSADLVFDECVRWWRSPWWPPVPVEFRELQRHAGEWVYEQKINMPCGPRWRVRQVRADRGAKRVERRFTRGVFSGGGELIDLLPEEASTKISYEFSFPSRNPAVVCAWYAVAKYFHRQSVQRVFHAMKTYLEADE